MSCNTREPLCDNFEPLCDRCKGRRLYCFLDSRWKEKVPFIDCPEYKIVTVKRIVRK